jgi:Protein of unknown function (DUF3037)
MQGASEFQYTILRLVPSVERGERINIGVVLFCRQRNFLDARTQLDPRRLALLTPRIGIEELATHLRALCDVAQGREQAGALASLSASERFGWLAASASTAIQPSPVHTGLTADPEGTLERLLQTLVAMPSEDDALPR